MLLMHVYIFEMNKKLLTDWSNARLIAELWIDWLIDWWIDLLIDWFYNLLLYFKTKWLKLSCYMI